MTAALSMPSMETLTFDHALFTPTIDPDSIRGVRTPSSREMALVAGVIKQAFDDARGKIGSCNSRRQRKAIKAEAQAWLADGVSPNRPGTWSFAFCCEVLGCSPEAAVARALVIVHSARALPRLKRARDTGGKPRTIEQPRPRGCGRGHGRRAA